MLLIDDGAHRVQLIREELARQGHEVVGVIDSATLIHDCVQRLAPDIVIVDSESPTRDTLENLATLSAAHPRPVVVFSEDAGHDPMQRALRAGVSAYVVAGLRPSAWSRCCRSRSPASSRKGCAPELDRAQRQLASPRWSSAQRAS